MPLYLVIGYKSKRMNPAESTVLYSGPDAAESKNILGNPNADYPARERFIRPMCNGGRRVDAPEASPAEESPAENPPAENPPAENPPAETPEEAPEETPKPKAKK